MVKEKNTTGLEIKPTQVAAGALAAVTAAVLGSNLGVAGTVVGAGLASIVSTVGATLYQHSIDRTREKVKSKVGARTDVSSAASVPEDAETVRFAAETVSPVDGEPVAKRRWPMAVAATVVAFVLGMLVITGVEWIQGASLSGGSGTTAGALFHQPADKPSHQPPPPTTTSPPPTTTSSPESTTTAPSTTSATPTTTTTPPVTTTTTPGTTTPTTSAPGSSTSPAR